MTPLIIATLLAAFSAEPSAPFSSATDQSLADAPWRFLREEPSAGKAELPDFDDNSWQSVSLPHTWNAQDGQSAGNYYRGRAWYRTRITPPGVDPHRRCIVRFGAASTVADVFVNGKPVGQHRGAFGAFAFDITPFLNPEGAANLLAVRVDNSPRPDVAPLSGDFTIFGGLYRDVHLLTVAPLSIDVLDDASPGVSVLQQDVSDTLATIRVTTRLRNFDTQPRAATIRCTLQSADASVAQASADAQIAPESTGETVQLISLANPHLWNGRADPYLYNLLVEVLEGGKVVSQTIQPLGLRSFRFDPDRGFFLNGKPYPLRGVNRHQDRINKGWAISPADHTQDCDLIMEMGCTAVRLAHYQHAEEFYRLCDQRGLIVWAELCLVDKLSPSPEFAANARQQLRELIKQNINHPSIVTWSISNELWHSRDINSKLDLMPALNALAKELDPSRPTVCADNGPTDYPLNAITDLLGFNRYWGWYDGSVENWSTKLDALHAALPGRPLAITEYGAGAGTHQHEASPAQPRTDAPWHPEEYQALVHEAAYNALKTRPWLWGTFVWNMFDFASPIRHEGEDLARNDKGLVTYDRATRKDAFYFYKANWSDQPVVYITSRRFSPRPSGPAAVKVYSNRNPVELFLGGVSLGSKSSENHVFIWPDVTLAGGPNQLRAVGLSADGTKTEDAIIWQCSPSAPAKLMPAPAAR